MGIPSDYAEYIRNWLYYEMSYDNYLNMLAQIDQFDQQGKLIDLADRFDVERARTNQERRENFVRKGVFPSELLGEALSADDLRDLIKEFGLDADMRRREDMIETVIDYFEHSQKYEAVDNEDSTVSLYLSSFEDIADGTVERIPPQLQRAVEVDDPQEKLEILFERATATIFEERFNLPQTTLLGQSAIGTKPDGEVEQDGRWLLWDNKRRSGPFRLDSSTRAKIKDYIETKNKHHDVEWFLIVAPEFADSAEKAALKMNKQVGIDIRLLTARDLRSLAEFWHENFATDNQEFPLSIFYGAGTFDLEPAKETLEEEFS